MKSVNKLLELYHETSKHSNYQIVASMLEKYISNQNIDVISRYEKERLKYFVENIDIKDKKILDIGGNTGFFTFELLNHSASKVIYYEGNKVHAQFVKEASKILDLEDIVNVHDEYFLFDNTNKDSYDVIFLLNVLHHVGDDYGDDMLTKEKALKVITKSLQSLASKTKILVFQLGFNWKGNRNLPLFDDGTKKEMIDFIAEGIKHHFTIETIGIAENEEKKVVYNRLNESNIQRVDDLGEFLNRPIFIMKSKLFHI